MTRSLRELEARLKKTVAVASSEVAPPGDRFAGQYVFRGADGEAFMWGPRPVRYEFHCVETVAEADHLFFLCPACFEANGGSVGTHSVMVSFAGRDIPEDVGTRDTTGKPSRWTASGHGVDDLVLTPSILLSLNGCHWHGWVGCNGAPPGHAI